MTTGAARETKCVLKWRSRHENQTFKAREDSTDISYVYLLARSADLQDIDAADDIPSAPPTLDKPTVLPADDHPLPMSAYPICDGVDDSSVARSVDIRDDVLGPAASGSSCLSVKPAPNAGTPSTQQEAWMYLCAETDDSLDSQRLAVQTYANGHKFDIVREFGDVVHSSHPVAGRKGLADLIRDAQKGVGKGRTLLLWTYSR